MPQRSAMRATGTPGCPATGRIEPHRLDGARGRLAGASGVAPGEIARRHAAPLRQSLGRPFKLNPNQRREALQRKEAGVAVREIAAVSAASRVRQRQGSFRLDPAQGHVRANVGNHGQHQQPLGQQRFIGAQVRHHDLGQEVGRA